MLLLVDIEFHKENVQLALRTPNAANKANAEISLGVLVKYARLGASQENEKEDVCR